MPTAVTAKSFLATAKSWLKLTSVCPNWFCCDNRRAYQIFYYFQLIKIRERDKKVTNMFYLLCWLQTESEFSGYSKWAKSWSKRCVWCHSSVPSCVLVWRSQLQNKYGSSGEGEQLKFFFFFFLLKLYSVVSKWQLPAKFIVWKSGNYRLVFWPVMNQ